MYANSSFGQTTGCRLVNSKLLGEYAGDDLQGECADDDLQGECADRADLPGRDR